MSETPDQWTCPFCGAQAVWETTPAPLGESRTCACGAIALAAPARDYDEITDDALNLFSIPTRPESRGSEALLRRDLLDAGIEIRDGLTRRVEIAPGRHDEMQSVWFRRR